MMDDANFAKLARPFAADEIEWRIQSCGSTDRGIWAIVIPYVSNRAIMDRLDECFGPANWRNEFAAGPSGGVMCGLSIWLGDRGWITKWDGAANTSLTEDGKPDVDSNVKGGLSAAMKRAAVQWGIGRYLYNLESAMATIGRGPYRGKTKDGTKFNWEPPTLPAWALPGGSGKGEVALAPEPEPKVVSQAEIDAKARIKCLIGEGRRMKTIDEEIVQDTIRKVEAAKGIDDLLSIEKGLTKLVNAGMF